jgi:dienelactone hydrolase
VLIPDSFTPRGFADGVCFVPGSQSATANGYVRAGDAYGALAALRALPFVDGKRVGVMGGSHGGWTVLAAMFDPREDGNALASAKREGFAAAVALYPGCAARYGDWSTAREPGKSFGPAVTFTGTYRPIAPMLILIGERDDWTPAEPCRRLAESSRGAIIRSTSRSTLALIIRSTATAPCATTGSATMRARRPAAARPRGAIPRRGRTRGSRSRRSSPGI